MGQDLVEARELLEKAAALMENAGWPGYAIEMADMPTQSGRCRPEDGDRSQTLP